VMIIVRSVKDWVGEGRGVNWDFRNVKSILVIWCSAKNWKTGAS
jgi:hypothetical protein